MAIDLAVAALAGLLAFMSPCVVPLIPGYLALLLGLPATGEAGRHGRLKGAVVAPMLFVGGFSVVFVSQGLLFGGLGGALAVHAGAIQRVGGAVALLLALVYSGLLPNLRVPAPGYRGRLGLFAAPVLGLACGLSWSPCLTPVLAVAVTLAATSATAARGALLMASFCVGLGVPFLVLSLGFSWTLAPRRFIRDHGRAIHMLSTVALVGFGSVMVLGLWDPWVQWLRAQVS